MPKLPFSPELEPLTPRYDAPAHDIYFGAIETALRRDDERAPLNIALSGGYGVGKSSILQKVAAEHKGAVALISMSTLGFADDETRLEGSAGIAANRTNRIQKEIVKQLLYGQDPVKMPGSRYRRITRFRFWREFGLAALVSVPLALVFFLSGWASALTKFIHLPSDWAWMAAPGIYVAGVLFIIGVRKVVHNRIYIDKITAAGTTFALSSRSETFFDEYLDEIVYFFERNKVDLVIFEDIDRFDDAHIFEALRSLNTLLNSAKQLQGRRIRFIYAIKDSIFEELGDRAAAEELSGDERDTSESERTPRDHVIEGLARANRTKFFDLVVPVVPFVTHRSARNLLKSALGQVPDHGVTDSFIYRVGRHLADMRLIRNIVNEYAIFHDRVIKPRKLDLSSDQMLAMVLYKNTHLSDFEKIKHASSNLDDLYAVSRRLVNENIARRQQGIREKRRALQTLHPASARSKELGADLDTYLNAHVQHIGGTLVSRGFPNTALSDEALRSAPTWTRIAAGEDIQVTFTHPVSNQPYSGVRNETFVSTFSREQLAHALRDSLSPDDWARSERDRLSREIDEARAEIDFLRFATMAELCDRPGFKVEHGGRSRSFEEALRSIIESELGQVLVRFGYIDQHFTLYTATFADGLLTKEAINFIIKCVEPNEVDFNFALESKDVRALLSDRGRTMLEERSAYNVSVLDYLLANDPEGAEALVRNFVRYGDDEKAFLLSYLSSGKASSDLIRTLTPLWPGVFEFMINDADLAEDERDRLVDVALGALGQELSYDTSPALRSYLESAAERLPAFVSEGARELARLIARFASQSGAELPSLHSLGTHLREAIAARGAYAVTRENLLLAIGGRIEGLALDELRGEVKFVYSRVLDDLGAYLRSLEAEEVSIASSEGLLQTVKDILAIKPFSLSHLSAVLQKAASGVELADIGETSDSAWPALAASRRVPATISNVKRYIDTFGLDESLAALLDAAEEIELDSETDEATKLALALDVLGAREQISSPTTRSSLVASLSLADYIPAGSVPVEAGDLIARLIADDVIDDTEGSFSLIGAADWAGREATIIASSAFSSIVTPVVLPAADLGRFFASNAIPTERKSAVIGRLTELSAGASPDSLSKAADFAIATDLPVGLAHITMMAGLVSSDRVLELLQPHLASIGLTELATVLSAMRGEFAKLAGPTGLKPLFSTVTPALAEVVARLRQLGVVGKTTQDAMGLRVNMRRSA
ncbi:YobI family P-loop NTPase [Schumannella soli]|uniref:YobI-like P-loop NTPase domain-containing protein n=1 Tax=Schumannella soli TaxID=2590779 RepID=A0A506YC87_9MICO|nr:hypothetical protein [Schumannella soli]TPW78049.1 hypothetical protein FJ657_05330 [Schumannella soli]